MTAKYSVTVEEKIGDHGFRYHQLEANSIHFHSDSGGIDIFLADGNPTPVFPCKEKDVKEIYIVMNRQEA